MSSGAAAPASAAAPAAAAAAPAAAAAAAAAPFDNGAGAGCRLMEILQWQCERLPDKNIKCSPLERVFRVCAGRPAVEVTHVVELDAQDRVVLPRRFQGTVPRSHHAKELKRGGV